MLVSRLQARGVRNGAVLGELIAAAEQRGHASMDRSQCCIAIGLDLLTIDADWFQSAFGIDRLLRHVTEHRVGDSLGRSLLVVQLDRKDAAGDGAVRLVQGMDEIICRRGLLAAAGE